MKRFLVVIFACLVFLDLSAQKDVTKFLGIPVDGSGKEMIEKLKDKGFTYSQKDDALIGIFNGETVVVDVDMQNDKVWRLIIEDLTTRDEEQIVTRFNSLVRQFESRDRKSVV